MNSFEPKPRDKFSPSSHLELDLSQLDKLTSKTLAELDGFAAKDSLKCDIYSDPSSVFTLGGGKLAVAGREGVAVFQKHDDNWKLLILIRGCDSSYSAGKFAEDKLFTASRDGKIQILRFGEYIKYTGLYNGKSKSIVKSLGDEHLVVANKHEIAFLDGTGDQLLVTNVLGAPGHIRHLDVLQNKDVVFSTTDGLMGVAVLNKSNHYDTSIYHTGESGLDAVKPISNDRLLLFSFSERVAYAERTRNGHWEVKSLEGVNCEPVVFDSNGTGLSAIAGFKGKLAIISEQAEGLKVDNLLVADELRFIKVINSDLVVCGGIRGELYSIRKVNDNWVLRASAQFDKPIVNVFKLDEHSFVAIAENAELHICTV